MSFQAYLDNIKEKTGKAPDDFRREARAAGLLAPGTTATQIVSWLAKDYGLGRGHAMAIFTLFKRKGWLEPAAKKVKR